MIREKRDMGMSITDISKDIEISRPTVRKYLKGKKPPEYRCHEKCYLIATT